MSGTEAATITLLGMAISSATAFTGIGLVLDIVGGVMLSFDLFWGYRKRNRLEVVETQLKGLLAFFDDIDRVIDGYGGAFTPQDRQKEKDKLRADYQPSLKALQDEKAALSSGHADKTFALGVAGMMLVLIGFGLQLLALFLQP
jgi:hypothetical protein